MEDSSITANGIGVGVSSQCMKGARIRSQQTGEFLATVRVDARSPARLLGLPGPQRRGTGGTLNLIGFPLGSEPPGRNPASLKDGA